MSPQVVIRLQTMLMDGVLNRYTAHVQGCRHSLLDGLVDAPCGDQLRQYFERGKMLRPLVVFAAAAAADARPAEAMTGARAIELLHVASLVHDDIMDGATERRGLPALHTRIGVEGALVAGDYLLLRAFGDLASARSTHPANRVLDALDALARYAQMCCHGQVDELEPGTGVDPEMEYLAVIRRKTAAQFALAASLGAILGSAPSSAVSALEEYGLNLGMAFQIRDDVLDLTAEPHVLGKPIGAAIALGRPSLPLIYLKQNGASTARARHDQLAKDELEQRALAALLERDRVLERVETRQEEYVEAALSALSPLPRSSGVHALQALLRHAVTRQA